LSRRPDRRRATEKGIGKSRLAAALRDRLDGEDLTRVRYFSSPHHQDSPVYPFIAQIAAALCREFFQAGFGEPAQRVQKLPLAAPRHRRQQLEGSFSPHRIQPAALGPRKAHQTV
jgi:hypothetical protein